MIEKYQRLTKDLEGQKKELSEMEERETERIKQIEKEEQQMEIDPGKLSEL